MDDAVGELPDLGAFVTAVLAQWDPDTRELCWLRFGHPLPVLVEPDGRVAPVGLERSYRPLGLLGSRQLEPERLTLSAGQRFVITSDGVWERRTELGQLFGLAGIRRAVYGTASDTPAAMASALARAVIEASPQPPRDDATVLVLGVDSGP